MEAVIETTGLKILGDSERIKDLIDEIFSSEKNYARINNDGLVEQVYGKSHLVEILSSDEFDFLKELDANTFNFFYTSSGREGLGLENYILLLTYIIRKSNPSNTSPASGI
jgi:hypothetical protein